MCVDEEVLLFQFMESVAKKIPGKWRSVGMALGLGQTQLNAIDSQHRGNPLDCFTEVFNHWQHLPTPQQPVSWYTLITVLRSVGEESLVDSIQETVFKRR